MRSNDVVDDCHPDSPGFNPAQVLPHVRDAFETATQDTTCRNKTMTLDAELPYTE